MQPDASQRSSPARQFLWQLGSAGVTQRSRMPSNSLQHWQGSRCIKLDEIVEAHRAVGGTGRGRRYATEQVNHAYAVLLTSQFQGYCRDLHSECVYHTVQQVPAALQNVL